MATNNVELVYWSARGLALPLRLLLTYTGQKFTDTGYTSFDKWFKEDKPTYTNEPFISLPFLKVGEKIYTESGALYYVICQLAKREDLCGSNFEDIIKIKTYEGVLTDLFKPIMEIGGSSDYATIKDKKFDEAVKPKFDGLVKVLKGKKWLVGDHLTIVDFRAYNVLTILLKMFPEQFNSHYTEIVEYLKRFEAIPEIAKYLKSEDYRKTNTLAAPAGAAKWELKF